MSHTTQNLYVRGIRMARFVTAIENRLRREGYVRVPEDQRRFAEQTEAELVRVLVRRDGRWTNVASESGFDSVLGDPDGGLEEWGRELSRELDRSVLTIWTWDGEGHVVATRYKRGEERGSIELTGVGERGEDGRRYAPAQPLWPWLPKKTRDAILRQGVPLVEPPESSGDPELDELLEDFEEPVDDEELAYVELETMVRALGAAVGMKNPLLNPYNDADDENVTSLLFSAYASAL